MEIVTDSSLRSADESYAYLTQIRQIVRYLGASSGDMEKGAMRCEANISIRPAGSRELGTKVEVKNLNSFRAVRSAIAYEAERQQQIVESGGHVQQETMGWDERANITRPQRSKETSDDYRYFPEPDLLVAELDDKWIARVHASLPELPTAKAARFADSYGLNPQEVAALVEDHAVAAYFEEAARIQGADPKQVGNWITGEIFRRLNAEGRSIEDVEIQPAALVELLSLVKKGTINQNAAREVFGQLWEQGGSPAEIVAARGLGQISDSGELDQAVAEVIAAHPDAVEKIKGGNHNTVQFLMGQVMRATRGKANPQLVQELLRQQLEI